jgi:hypothetical protein
MSHQDIARNEALRAKARQAIRGGQLPLWPQGSMYIWAGRGTGHTCVVCHAPVRMGEIEFEVQRAPPDCPELQSLRFHSPCWTAWQEETQGPGDLTGRINGTTIPGHESGAANGRAGT